MGKTSDHKLNLSEPKTTDLDTIQISTSQSNSKKVNRVWKTSDAIALIAGVEKYPRLWTSESTKLGRDQDWNKILSELDIKGMVQSDLRSKWHDLRSNVIQSDKRGIPCKWAEYMLFLGLTRAYPPNTEKLAQDEASDSKGKRKSISESSTSNIDVSQPNKRRCIQPLPKSSNVSSSSPCVPSAQDLPALDPNSALCNHILAELRVLPDIESRHLRRLLIKASYSFRDI